MLEIWSRKAVRTISFLALTCIPVLAQIQGVKKLVLPKYPPVALAARLQGNIQFELQILSTGAVSDVKIIQSFTKVTAATKPLIHALSRWEFTPGSARTQLITLDLKILPQSASVLDEISEITDNCHIVIAACEIFLEKNHGY